MNLSIFSWPNAWNLARCWRYNKEDMYVWILGQDESMSIEAMHPTILIITKFGTEHFWTKLEKVTFSDF